MILTHWRGYIILKSGYLHELTEIDPILVVNCIMSIVALVSFDFMTLSRYDVRLLARNRFIVNCFIVVTGVVNVVAYFINSRLATYYTMLYIKSQEEDDELGYDQNPDQDHENDFGFGDDEIENSDR